MENSGYQSVPFAHYQQPYYPTLAAMQNNTNYQTTQPTTQPYQPNPSFQPSPSPPSFVDVPLYSSAHYQQYPRYETTSYNYSNEAQPIKNQIHHHSLCDEKSVVQAQPLDWLQEGWHMYLNNWATYSLFVLCWLLIPWVLAIVSWTAHSVVARMLCLVGIAVVWPCGYGLFIAGSHLYKKTEMQMRGESGNPQLRHSDLLRAYLLYLPLLVLGFVYGLLVELGLLLLIVPGIYLAITLSFAPYIFIEYHRQADYTGTGITETYGVCQSLWISRRTVHRQFWRVLLYWILYAVLNIIGFITIVGWIVTIPVTHLSVVPAFRDLFEFQIYRKPDDRPYCCAC